jgi:hypothetical protein
LAVLLPSSLLFAQEKSLGDIARESRAEKPASAKAKKTLIEEDTYEKPLSETEDPLDGSAKRKSHSRAIKPIAA